MNKIVKIIIYGIFPVSIFLLLIKIRPSYYQVYLDYGMGKASIGALYLLLYGVYLTIILIFDFYSLIRAWIKKKVWKNKIILYFSLIIIYSVLISILAELDSSYSKRIDLEDITSNLYFIGLSIAFPLGIINIIASIISFLYVKRLNQKRTFSIVLLILSLVTLLVSFTSFVFVLDFWIKGGFHC